jgi:hypothetical protein
MNVIHIEGDSYCFEEEMNIQLIGIKEAGHIVIDIKYSSSSKDGSMHNYSAVIIYCDKAEYRELQIDKILDKID